MVDGARVIKRMRPAPQGRGYRVRKRSNHVTVVVDAKTEAVAKVAKKAAVKTEAAPVAAPKKAAAKKKTKSVTE